MDNLKISELTRTPTLQTHYKKSLLNRSSRSKSTLDAPVVSAVTAQAIQLLHQSFKDLAKSQNHMQQHIDFKILRFDFELLPLKLKYLQNKIQKLENIVSKLQIQQQNKQFTVKTQQQIQQSLNELSEFNDSLRKQVNDQQCKLSSNNNMKNNIQQVLLKHNFDKFHQKSEIQRDQYVDEIGIQLDRILDQKYLIKQLNDIFDQKFINMDQVIEYSSKLKISEISRRESNKSRRESGSFAEQDKGYYQQLCQMTKQNESLINENVLKNDLLKDLKIQLQGQIKRHENYQKKIEIEKEKENQYFVIKIQDLEKEIQQLRDRDTEFQQLQAEKDRLIQQYVVAFSENINIVEEVKKQNDDIASAINSIHNNSGNKNDNFSVLNEIKQQLGQLDDFKITYSQQQQNYNLLNQVSQTQQYLIDSFKSLQQQEKYNDKILLLQEKIINYELTLHDHQNNNQQQTQEIEHLRMINKEAGSELKNFQQVLMLKEQSHCALQQEVDGLQVQLEETKLFYEGKQATDKSMQMSQYALPVSLQTSALVDSQVSVLRNETVELQQKAQELEAHVDKQTEQLVKVTQDKDTRERQIQNLASENAQLTGQLEDLRYSVLNESKTIEGNQKTIGNLREELVHTQAMVDKLIAEKQQNISASTEQRMNETKLMEHINSLVTEQQQGVTTIQTLQQEIEHLRMINKEAGSELKNFQQVLMLKEQSHCALQQEVDGLQVQLEETKLFYEGKQATDKSMQMSQYALPVSLQTSALVDSQVSVLRNETVELQQKAQELEAHVDKQTEQLVKVTQDKDTRERQIQNLASENAQLTGQLEDLRYSVLNESKTIEGNQKTIGNLREELVHTQAMVDKLIAEKQQNISASTEQRMNETKLMEHINSLVTEQQQGVTTIQTLQQEIEHLRMINKEAGSELKNFQQVLMLKEQSHCALQQEVDGLQVQLEETKLFYEGKQATDKSMQMSQYALPVSLQTSALVDSQVSVLRNETVELQQKAQELEAHVDKQTEQLVKVTQDKDTRERQIQNLASENAQLTGQLEDLRYSVLNESKTIEGNQKTIGNLREELVHTQAMVDKLIAEKQQNISASTEQRMNETKLMEHINSLVTEQQQGVTTIQTLQQEIEHLRMINKEAGFELKNFQQVLMLKEQSHCALQQEVDGLQVQLEETKLFYEGKQATDKSMQMSQYALPVSLQTSALVDSQVSVLRNETVELQQKAQELEAHVDKQTEQLVKVTQDKDTRERQIQNLASENAQLTGQLEDLRYSVLNESKTIEGNQKTIGNLREELVHTQAMVDKLIAEKQQNISASTEQRMNETKLMEHINSLVTEQQQGVTTIQTLQQEIEHLRMINKEAGFELKNFQQVLMLKEQSHCALQQEVDGLQVQLEETKLFYEGKQATDKSMQMSQYALPVSLQTSALVDSQVSVLRNETVELQQKAQELEAHVDKQTEQLVKVTQDKDTRERQIQNLASENAQLTGQLEDLRYSVLNESKTIEGNQKTIGNLREELVHTQAMVDKLIAEKQQNISASTEQRMNETKLMEHINSLVTEQQQGVTTIQTLQQEIEHLRMINKEAGFELKNFQQVLMLKEQSHCALQQEVDGLQVQLEETKLFYEGKQATDKSMQMSQYALPVSLQTSALVDSQVSVLRNETVELQQKAQELEAHVDKQTEQLVKVTQDKDTRERQIQNLASENAQLTGQLEDLRYSVLNESKTIEGNQKTIGNLREELVHTQAMVDKLIAEKQQNISASTEQRMNETKLMEHINSLVTEQQQGVTTIQTLQQEIEHLRMINKEAGFELKNFQQVLMLKEQSHCALQQEVDGLQVQLEETKLFYEGKQATDKSMQMSQYALPVSLQTSALVDSQVSVLRNETVELQQKAQELEDTVVQLNNLISDIQSQKQQLKQQLLLFESENLNLTKQLLRYQNIKDTQLPDHSNITASSQTILTYDLIDVIDYQNDTLKFDLRQQQHQNQEVTKIQFNLQTQVQDLREQNIELNMLLKRQQEKNLKLLDINKFLEKQLDSNINTTQQSNLQNDQKQTNIIKSQQHVNDLEKSLKNLNKDCKIFKQKLSETQIQLDNKDEFYQTQLQQQAEELLLAHRERDNSINTLKQVQKDLQETKQDLITLKQNLNSNTLQNLVQVQEQEILLLKQQMNNQNNSMVMSQISKSQTILSALEDSIIAPKSVIEDIRSIKLLVFDVFQLSEDERIRGQLKQACDRLATVIFALTFKQNCDFLDQSEDLAFSRLLIEKQEERQKRMNQGSLSQLEGSQVSLSGFI
ncbi:hypothetical protein SS50377_25695 [Spironucleus salmonicida]|uniref:Uncharacterized protein n=1 Tax=Spironucleus salmonicida TaxID=348837 RepID=A0A9P8LNV6_9EUKA|nr:hypothetical protein SS50377_25695 [Spironucleus salmonicida]